jgi:hypothetical protein
MLPVLMAREACGIYRILGNPTPPSNPVQVERMHKLFTKLTLGLGLVLALLCTHTLAAGPLHVVIDDNAVADDTYYPGCYWKHCIKKAKKLKKHYLKERVLLEIGNTVEAGVTEVDAADLRNGLKITVSASAQGSGRGVAEFAVETVTLGAAPMGMDVTFVVKSEVFQNGIAVRSSNDTIHEKRNISVLADTQKYVEKAAVKIAKVACELLRDVPVQR